MTSEVIRNRSFQLMGFVETRSDGTQVAKDRNHRILGYFNPKSNDTRDATYKVIGRGNLLSSLISAANDTR